MKFRLFMFLFWGGNTIKNNGLNYIYRLVYSINYISLHHAFHTNYFLRRQMKNWTTLGEAEWKFHIGGYSPLRPNEEARGEFLPSHPSFTNKFVPWVVPTYDISFPSFWTEKHHTLTSKGERHLWRKFIFNINCEKYSF